MIIATGYVDDPPRFPVVGSDLSKVLRIHDEPYRFAGLDIAVIGGRNSAAETVLDLYRNKPWAEILDSARHRKACFR
ncbi:MAG: NAD(P)-binding domain-containing protein [Proteobacteria bacterium]|nr:NAD(P)-binding domain-containing protein [Pseudomonadota bacterium]